MAYKLIKSNKHEKFIVTLADRVSENKQVYFKMKQKFKMVPKLTLLILMLC